MAVHVTETLLKRSASQAQSLGDKIVRNAASGVLRMVVVAPIPFLLTPFLLRHVGTMGYGTWAVLLSINGLTALADLGVVGTLTKHVSEHFTRQDYVKVNRVVNAGILMFLVIAALCALAINLTSGFLISVFFRQSSLAVWQLQHLIRLLTIAIALNLLAFPFASVISGLQRLDLSNLLWALSAIITALAAAVFVTLGQGIAGLIHAIVLTSSILFVLNAVLAWRLLPQLRIEPRMLRMADINELCSFSLQLYVAQMATAVYFHTEKLLLAHFTGPTPVGWYDIANDLAMKIRNGPALMLVPLMPAAAELKARGDDAKTSELYYRTHKYLAVLSVAMVTIVGLLAHRFVELWLGLGFSATSKALIVLTVVQIGNLVGGPALLILVGKGNLRPAVRFAVAGMVGTVILSTVLISRFGFTGALYGTSISVLGATVYLVYMFHQEMSYSGRRLIHIYVKPVMWGICVAALIGCLVPVSRLHWPGMIAVSFGITVANGAGLLLLRYFDVLDLRALERFLPVPHLLRRSSLFSDVS
jgi:O-antigen/teichoic acid export membrane protein